MGLLRGPSIKHFVFVWFGRPVWKKFGHYRAQFLIFFSGSVEPVRSTLVRHPIRWKWRYRAQKKFNPFFWFGRPWFSRPCFVTRYVENLFFTLDVVDHGPYSQFIFSKELFPQPHVDGFISICYFDFDLNFVCYRCFVLFRSVCFWITDLRDRESKKQNKTKQNKTKQNKTKKTKQKKQNKTKQNKTKQNKTK